MVDVNDKFWMCTVCKTTQGQLGICISGLPYPDQCPDGNVMANWQRVNKDDIGFEIGVFPDCDGCDEPH